MLAYELDFRYTCTIIILALHSSTCTPDPPNDLDDNNLDHDCQFLPDELLVALSLPKAPGALRSHQLGLSHQQQRPLHGTPSNPMKKPSANAWNYPNQREKRKNLMRSSPCVCGAGQDISFLYDVPVRKTQEFPKIVDANDNSQSRVQTESKEAEFVKMSDSLIPEEYCIVKNRGWGIFNIYILLEYIKSANRQSLTQIN